MVEIARIPNRYFDSIGGKDIHHVAWYGLERGPVTTKAVMDIVTDDGAIYRWSRFNDSEKWSFEHRVRDEGGRDDARRRLPGKVASLVERDPTVRYK